MRNREPSHDPAAKTPPAPPEKRPEDKPRIVKRHLPMCAYPECDHRFETRLTQRKALSDAVDHAITSGHVYTKEVQVRRVRAVVREEILA